MRPSNSLALERRTEEGGATWSKRDIPELHQFIEAAGCQRSTVRGKGHIKDVVRVAAQDGMGLAGGKIPEDDFGNVPPRRHVENLVRQGEPLAIGRKPHGQNPLQALVLRSFPK